MLKPKVCETAQGYSSWIGYYELAALTQCSLYFHGYYRVCLCDITANSQNAGSFSNFADGISHSITAKACHQAFHRRRMTEPGAVVNTVGAHRHAGEFLDHIVVLIGAFGRGDRRKLIAFVLGKCIGHHLKRLFPRDCNELVTPLDQRRCQATTIIYKVQAKFAFNTGLPFVDSAIPIRNRIDDLATFDPYIKLTPHPTVRTGRRHLTIRLPYPLVSPL